MTIPSRPAPAPPGSRAQIAAAGANASIEQLRLQLAQQHMQQQQNGGIQKMTIKLPPPPKGRPTLTKNGWESNHSSMNGAASSITRKFPQARYTPATDWDDSPFSQMTSLSSSSTATSTATTNGNGDYKKAPPPRPPPPKIQVNGGGVRKMNATPPIQQSTNILTNIFNRKKSATTKSTRIYGVSSGNYNNNSSSSSSNISNNGNCATAASNYNSTAGTTQHFNNINSSASYSTTSSTSVNWNANWDTITTRSNYGVTSAAAAAAAAAAAHDAQLISFDSPPSSPTFTQKSNSDCLSVDSFSSDSNFSSPNNGSVSQPESGFEDDFSAAARSRPATTSPLDPWETFDAMSGSDGNNGITAIGTAPVRNLNAMNARSLASTDNPLCNGKSLLPPAPSLTAPTIIKPKISQKPKAPKPPVFGVKPFSQHTNGVDLPTPPSPPMPQCPPPPPPTGVSLLDVISGKVDAIHLGSVGAAAYSDDADSSHDQAYGVAIYDFNGLEEGDLCFRENEKIYLLEQVSDEWYRGRTRSGCEGIFPANYIDIKVPLQAVISASAAAFTAAATSSIASSSGEMRTYQQQNGFSRSFSNHHFAPPRVRCLFNFPAEVDGDLALKENDLVTILYRINEDWLFGEIDGRQGQFPSNFLEYVPANIPMP